MKAQNYLKQIKAMDAKIDTSLQELERLQAIATKVTSTFGDERVQSSGSQSKMADCVAKIVDMSAEIGREVDAFVDFKKECIDLIRENCSADCMNLLYKRYFQYMTWEQISVEMNFTYKWTSGGLHQKALQEVQAALDKKKR